MQKRWLLASPSPNAGDLARVLDISKTLAQILISRGFDTPEAARAFLHPRLQDLADPLLLPDMPAAVERVRVAIKQNERIVIYGDYDVDGVTSTALLVRMLTALGGKVEAFLPLREDEGYGLTADGFARCLADYAPSLLLAVDCGTNSVGEIAEAKKRGVDVIVLDHHEPKAQLPDCPVVNPKRLTENPPWKELCSAGLAFKFVHAFLKFTGHKSFASNLKSHLDLVALGTIADIVPLTGENRILAKAGLEQLEKTDKNGLVQLMTVAQLKKNQPVTPYDVGFRLGPRLNAAGRLGDAKAALELLMTENDARARELALFLDTNNRERQQTQEQMVKEALAMLKGFDPSQRALVLAHVGWHIGIVGIVASRVMKEFYRPTVIIGLDEEGKGRGSCRSIEGFDIAAALRQCDDLLERQGGHAMAAGLSILAGNVEAFQKRLDDLARRQLSEDQLAPPIHVDAEVPLSDVNEQMLADLDRLQPFGASNPTPLFCARGLEIKNRTTVGAEGKHLKLRLGDGNTFRSAIGFGLGAVNARISDRADILFSAAWNEFQGKREIQLNLKEIAVLQSPP